MLLAHLKRILKLDRLRLRGPSGARDEFLLAATAQNLRKLAKLGAPASPLPPPEQERSTPASQIDDPQSPRARLRPDFFDGIGASSAFAG